MMYQCAAPAPENKLLTSCSCVLLEKLTSLQLSRNSPHFMEPQGSLLHSQVPATCPYPGPARSSPYLHTLLPEDPFQYYPPIYALASQVVSFPQVSPPTPCIRLSYPPYALHTPPISFFSILYNTGWAVQIIHLLTMQFSPLPCYLVPPWVNCEQGVKTKQNKSCCGPFINNSPQPGQKIEKKKLSSEHQRTKKTSKINHGREEGSKEVERMNRTKRRVLRLQ